jgi:hypothetical protein
MPEDSITQAEAGGIQLARLESKTISLMVKGTAPLIVHKWAEKAMNEMLAKQMGKKSPKEFKDPQAQFESSLYRLPDGSHGFPVVAFKAATVGAARYFKGITMVQLSQGLRFHGEGPDQLAPITGEVVLREDMVKVGSGLNKVADIRYRGMFPDWTARLSISFLPSQITLDSVIAVVDAGGMGGIGEWRPEKAKTGTFGTYEVLDQVVER